MNSNSVYIAWRAHDEDKTWSPIGRLDREDENHYLFLYTQGSKRTDFKPFPGMTDLSQVYRSKELFPMFSDRLLNSRRQEYQNVLKWSGFSSADSPDPLAILQVTEGRRSTDYYEVFPRPVPDENGMYRFRFFLHGIEWLHLNSQQRGNTLKTGDRLLCMYDIQNSYDEHAVALRTEDDRTIVGYLPRYLARDLKELVNGCDPEYVNIVVNRINQSAPLQFRILCDMTACWPGEYVPFQRNDFVPIPEAKTNGMSGKA